MDRRWEIISELTKGMEETVVFFQSLTPEQLNTRIYQEGARWTVKQVMAHFITIEGSMHRLFKDILAGGPGSPKDFDVDRFNLRQTQKLEGQDLPTLIRQFKAVRLQTIAIVEQMSEKDLRRKGRHAFHGKGRLERFIRWAWEHARIHEDEIRNFFGLGKGDHAKL